MTPEGRFLHSMLLALAGSHSPPALTPEGLNWGDLRNRVKKHLLGPLFARRLPENTPLPDPVRKEWEEEYRKQLARSVLAGGCLREILEGFAAQGIESIALKGIHLGETYYPHPALRPAEDLDLLVRPRDGEAAGGVLERAGGRSQEETVTAKKYLFPETGVFVELHTDLQTEDRRNPAFAVRIEDFWAESRSARIAGGETRILSPTINLLYLAAHLSHHSFSRLLWFHDLFLVIEKSGAEIDWDQLAAWSRGYRCAGQVYYPLLLTGRIFGKTAPDRALKTLAPPQLKRTISGFFINLGAVLEGRTPEPGRLARRNRFLLNDNWPLALKAFIA